MQKVFSWDFSEREDDCDRRIMKESTMTTGTEDTFGRSSANERKHRDSKGNHASKYETEEDDDGEEEDDENNEEEDQGSGKLVEYPGGEIDSPKAQMRIESVEGDSFDDDDDDDDERRSSACSEAITGDGDFSGLPSDLHLLLPTKYSTLDRNFKLHSKADSLVEALEKRRRQTVGNRLKELRTTSKTRPLATATDPAIREMPIIARRSPSKDFAVLPKQTTTQRRSRNYESVIVVPFFSKSKPSSLHHHHHHHRLPVGSPDDNGRRHFAKGQRETGDLRGMEHRSNRPRCGLPMGEGDQWYSDRPSTGNAVLRGASAAAAAAAAAAQSTNSQLSSSMEIAGNKCDDDDATPRQRDGRQGSVANGNERRQFLGDKPEEAESVRKTDRSKKESGNETERASSVTALPRLSSSSTGDLSFGGMASTFPPSNDDLQMWHPTLHSCDIRTIGPASRDTDNNLLRSGFNTTETPPYISKIRDNLTDTVLMDNTALHSNASTLNEDGAKYKASGGRGDFIPKTNSTAGTVETRKYYSDIHIKLKEAEPVFPSSFNRSREVTQIPNGGVPDVSRSSSSSKEREADEESEISENVTPNWSSYPGPLLSASTAHESEEDEEAIGIIGRNTSDVNRADADADADTEAKYNKLSNADCFVREISTPSTKVDDCQTNQIKTKDSDPERCSYAINLNAAAAERSIGSDRHLQPSAVFVSNNNYRTTNTKKISDHKSASDGSPRCRSTERREAYLVESLSVNRRILTRDSNPTRSASSNPTGRRADDDGSCKERSSTAQDNYEPASTARRSRQEVSSIGAVNSRGLFSAQENAGTATDRLKKQQSSDTTIRLNRDGVSGSANLRWESPATGIDDQKTGERVKSSSSSSSRRRRSPGKTASIERIWQSIEEPRPRPRLRRKIRFEPEPGSPSSTDRSSSSRRCRAVSCDGGGSAVDVVDAAPMENGVHRQNTLSDEKDEFSLLEIEVPKVGLGLGFCIDGGKGGPYGDRPITVKRLFRGSSDPTPSAVNAKLCPGDEILSANGRNMTLLSRYVAWNYLKTLPEGTIRLVVRRQH